MKTTLLRAFALFSAAWLCMGGAKADVAPVEPSADGAGVYQIGTAAELVWFSNFVNESTSNVTAKAVLTADIDMSEVDNFTPIGKTAHSGTYNDNAIAFKGTFDGQGHVVSNLTISLDNSQPWQAGFFGRINGATVSNLGLQNVSITQTSTTAAAAGALAGRNGSSTVRNCYALNVIFTQTASASSGTSATSGLVGYMSAAAASILDKCYTDYATLAVKGSDASITDSYCGSDVTSKAPTGELCYLLNGDQSKIVWYQTLGDGGDAYPVLDYTHYIVYKDGEDYDNLDLPYEDGYYLIGNAAQLVKFSKAVNAGCVSLNGKLTADIDMSAVDNFTPIGKAVMTNADARKTCFLGKFDGQGHAIRNLTIVGAADGNTSLGLFSRVYSTSSSVKNLFMEHVKISTPQTTAVSIGPIVGHLDRTTVENCGAIDVTINHPNFTSGGTAQDGGVCGYMVSQSQSNMVNCYTDYVSYGGKGDEAIVINCYAKSDFDTKAASGELCYLLNGDQSNIVWKQTIGTDAYPVLNSDHETVSLALGCDGYKAYNNTGLGLNNHSFEDGRCTVCGMEEGGEYEIDSVEKLLWFGGHVNAGNGSDNAKLTDNIDMTDESWMPMTGFAGTLDGGNFTISNLAAPLFLTTAGGATIQNLTIDGNPIVQAVAAAGFGAFVANHTAGALTLTDCTNKADITSKEGQVGGLVGRVSGQVGASVMLTRCNNYGAISSASGKGNLGGIMGDASCQTVTIRDCHNYGDVTMTGTIAQAAGILATHRSAGNTNSSLTVEDSHNAGSISGGANGSGHSNSGGIVGWVAATANYTRTISIARCYNTGNLQFTGDQFGGIGGNFSKNCNYTITDCYNTGTIEATADQPRVCAIVGLFENLDPLEAAVSGCWNSGTITNSTETNTLTSTNHATIENCFDTQCSATGVTIVTTDQLASGEVTYKLNGDQSDIKWTQTIGTDNIPVLGTTKAQVYQPVTSGANSYYANSTSDFTLASMILTDMADYAADANFTATSLTYNRTLEAGGYHSLCLPFAVTTAMLGEGSKLFEVSAVGTDAVTLTEVNEVAAGTPCFASVTSDFTFGTMSNVAMVASVTNGTNLQGTFTNQTINAGFYKLSPDGTYFGLTTDGATATAFRSYIAAGSGSVKSLNILLSDGTSLTPTLSEEQPKVIYDLSGRRVEKATKGLYIINGKKVVK